MKQLHYLLILLIPLLAYGDLSQAQQKVADTTKPAIKTSDTTAKADTIRKKWLQFPSNRQLRLSIDLANPAMSFIYDDRSAFELAVDYTYKDEMYLTAEVGHGTSTYAFTDLSYQSANTFVKLGFDKNMLFRAGDDDWDIGFIGIRACGSIVNRGQGSFLINDPLWGNAAGTVAPASPFNLWFELTAGIKVELIKNCFLGWTARGKIMITQGAFKELPPAYIAGFGKGDKPSAVSFNLYVSYALRWKKE